MALERWGNPKLALRACTCEYGLQSWRGKSAGVAKRPREESPDTLTLRFATFASQHDPTLIIFEQVVCPVDAHGRFTEEADQLAPAAATFLGAPLHGLKVLKEGTAAVLDALREAGRLLHTHDYAHKYPYDWRTKQPVIVRATQQVGGPRGLNKVGGNAIRV
jgi:hypothetical protein